MLDLAQLPRGALRDVREFVRDNNLVRPSDHSKEACDAYIATMSPKEFLDAYLKWNGIIGYTDDIVGVLDDARAAEAVDWPKAVAAEVRKHCNATDGEIQRFFSEERPSGTLDSITEAFLEWYSK